MKLELPSLCFQPAYTSKVNSWHDHLHFAYDLVANFRPRTLVELGVHYGDSYFTFCQAIRDQELECNSFGVDRWSGEIHSGFYDEEVWDIVSNYNNANYNFSRLIRKEFTSALEDFEELSIDLLHLDGCHTYEAVKNDFCNWLPKISEQGIILLHDIHERSNGFGVWKLWEELKHDFKTFSFPFGHGLGLIFKDCNVVENNKYFNELLTSDALNLYYKSKSKNRVSSKGEKLTIAGTTNDDENLKKSIHQNVILSDKIRRIQNSFSWKVTAPLRLLRRKILDPFTRKEGFDARLYLQLNPDLHKIYGSDYEAATNHFRKWGKKQGRMYLNAHEDMSYPAWVNRFDTNDISRLEQFKIELSYLEETPLFSIIIPIFNSDVKLLRAAIDSVTGQIYLNWELILVDDNSSCKKLLNFLNEIEKSDEKIILIRRNQNGHISEACNSGLDAASGRYFAILDHDDLLREHTILRMCQSIKEYPDCKIIYSDEDKICLKGERCSPHFKPDWNPELLLSQNYICHICFFETKYIKDLEGYRVGYEGCQDWDLLLRASENLNENQIIHIPQILYHWRMTKKSTASKISAKNYVYKNSLKVVKSAWERRGIEVSVESYGFPNNYVRSKISTPECLPLVSIIIPTRDNLKHLEKCIDSLIYKTSYPNFEVLVMDNGSRERGVIDYLKKLNSLERFRIVNVPGEFNFSKICNFGASKASGCLILFLNDDVEAITNDWLSEMVVIASRKEVGCVGAKLLYPNDTVQHAGIILGLGGYAGHAFRRFPRHHNGYASRLDLVQNYSAVTGACLLVRKEVFFKVSGFDENFLKIAFNDVDLCLKVLKAGLKNVWTPHALLYHYESASRGDDLEGKNYKRFLSEGNHMRNKWSEYLLRDPAYNPNLSICVEDFSIAAPRETNF